MRLALSLRLITLLDNLAPNYVLPFKNVLSVHLSAGDHLGKGLSSEQCCWFFCCGRGVNDILGVQSYRKINTVLMIVLHIFADF